MGDIKEKLD
ncbi:hypothetical protein SPV_2466 [Streptococcus pneumoniae]|nr:hypothetical protein SPV_2466 [Streptococcus pneumoniae]